MLINGIEILEQSTFYTTTWYGDIFFCILLLGGFIYMIFGFIYKNVKMTVSGAISCLLILILVIISTSDTSPTFLNKPNKIQYTIEIKDDNAWKEIGPNYKVIKKIYNNKEIYLIEGDYVND